MSNIVALTRYSCSAHGDAPVYVNREIVVGFKPAQVPDTGADGVKIKTSAQGKNFVVTTPLDAVKETFPEFVEVDGAFYAPGTEPAPKVVASFAPKGESQTLVRYTDGSQQVVDQAADAFAASLA